LALEMAALCDRFLIGQYHREEDAEPAEAMTGSGR